MPRSHLPAATSRAVSRSPPEGFLRQVGLDAAQPLFRLRFAELDDHGRDQRVVVHMLARPDADLALPFRVGQFLVSDGGVFHPLLGRIRDARAQRDAVPVPFRIAVLRGDDLVQRGGLDRLGDAALHGFFKPPDIDGEQHVRRAVGAFRLDALLEAVARRNDVDLDAGILGEGVKQRLDQFSSRDRCRD